MADINPFGDIGGSLVSLYELLKSQSALKNLNSQPIPQFTPTPELLASKGRADQMSNFGYTPQEKGTERQNVAQDINAQTQKALDLGGGSLAKTIGGIGKINETANENKFALGDAELHRQNIKYSDKFAEQLQALSDKNIAEQQRERLMAEQALGGAAQTGLAGIGTSLNYLGTAEGAPKATDPNAQLMAYLKTLNSSSGATSGSGFGNAGGSF